LPSRLETMGRLARWRSAAAAASYHRVSRLCMQQSDGPHLGAERGRCGRAGQEEPSLHSAINTVRWLSFMCWQTRQVGSTVDSDCIKERCGTCSGLRRFYSSCSEKCPCIWFCSFLQVYLLTLALLTRALGHARKLSVRLSLCFPLSQELSSIKHCTHPWPGQVSGAEASERCLMVPCWWVHVPHTRWQELRQPS